MINLIFAAAAAQMAPASPPPDIQQSPSIRFSLKAETPVSRDRLGLYQDSIAVPVRDDFKNSFGPTIDLDDQFSLKIGKIKSGHRHDLIDPNVSRYKGTKGYGVTFGLKF